MTISKPGAAPGTQEARAVHGTVIRSAGIALLGSVLGGVLVILNEFLVAHYLKVQTYGLYASGMTVARIGEAIAVFGLPVAIFQFIPLYRRDARNEDTVGVVIAAGLLPLGLGCAFAAALWIAAPLVALHVFHAADVAPYIRVLALAVPFMAATEILGAITRGYGHAKYYVLVKNVMPPVVFLTLVLSIIFLGGLPLWVAGAVAASYGVAFVAGILAVARVAGPDLWRLRPVFRFRTLYTYAAGVMMNAFFYMIFAMTGIIVVAFFLGSDSVGIYRVCLQVILPFEMVMLAFHAATGPVYSVLAREQNSERLEEAYGTAVRWMVILLFPAGVILGWNGGDLLGLLGPEFTAGALALLILAAGHAASTCFGTVAYILMLSGRKSVETANAALATVMNIALCLVLVPRYGLAGAAAATTSAYVLLNVLRVVEVRRLIGLRTFQPYFLRVAAVSAGTGPAAFVVLQFLDIAQGQTALAMVIRILAMMAMQVLGLWTLGLNRADKDMLRGVFRSFAQRLMT